MAIRFPKIAKGVGGRMEDGGLKSPAVAVGSNGVQSIGQSSLLIVSTENLALTIGIGVEAGLQCHWFWFVVTLFLWMKGISLKAMCGKVHVREGEVRSG